MPQKVNANKSEKKKKEKEIQEGKVAVWMALHIAEERREAKSKGER